MWTSRAEADANHGTGRPVTSPATQRVMVVNGSAEILPLLETVLEAGHYDIVFVESGEHAYSQIKRVLPNLVILCVDVNQMEGFQILSMLKLDVETRDIPVLTYTMALESGDEDEDATEAVEVGALASARAAIRMN